MSGWGRFPVCSSHVSPVRSQADVQAMLCEGALIARGNGRAYGDSAIGTPRTLDMRPLNRMLAFDSESGVLVAEAGVLLADVIDTFLPRGWFPLVTPGTRFVTLGGMAAADVHGKNHHRVGSFSSCVEWIDLLDHHGEIRRLTADATSDLFGWTLGGMGLTGIIMRIAIRLQRVETAWICETTLPAENLQHCMEQFEANSHATYSVAWIDCLASGEKLGRSLLMLGEHAKIGELDRSKRTTPFSITPKWRLQVPFDAPSFALNSLTVRAFNAMVYAKGKRSSGTRLADWESYFYPLDSVLGWNRIYGRRGFAQFQCVLPLESSPSGLRELLGETARSGQGSFLAVLKRFGPQVSPFSFPTEGYTLALDFPISTRSLALLDRLDKITLAHGGRFYLAKDSRMTAATLQSSDCRVAAFQAMRREIGAQAHFSSCQSERLCL